MSCVSANNSLYFRGGCSHFTKTHRCHNEMKSFFHTVWTLHSAIFSCCFIIFIVVTELTETKQATWYPVERGENEAPSWLPKSSNSTLSGSFHYLVQFVGASFINHLFHSGWFAAEATRLQHCHSSTNHRFNKIILVRSKQRQALIIKNHVFFC